MRDSFLPLNLQSLHLLPEGDFFCLSQSQVAACATMYLEEFPCFFSNECFSLGLGFVLCGEQKQNLPPFFFFSAHNKHTPSVYVPLKKVAVFMFLSTQPPCFIVVCASENCTHLMSGVH